MRFYLDAEFTGLVQNARLISLALLTDDGHYFYAEFYDYGQAGPWIEVNVIRHLFGNEIDQFLQFTHELGLTNVGSKVILHTQTANIWASLLAWLESFKLGPGEGKVWGDVLGYDWVLLCELFGGGLKLPTSIYYIPFDLATLLLERGLDPDIEREAFAGLGRLPVSRKHNALWDAFVIREAVRKLGVSDPKLGDLLA